LVPHGHAEARSLRLIGADMKINDYLDTGHINNQISPGWWAN